MSIDKIINANENKMARRLYKTRLEDGGTGEYLMKHIPIAQWLIAKYSKEPWKNSPNHHHYVFKEYQLCSMIEDVDKYQKDKFYAIIAILLECSPVLLHNDAEMPF